MRTPRCILEPLVAAHAHEMFRVLSDPAIYEFENEPPRSEEWLTERYAFLEARKSPDGTKQWLNWVVRLASGELAGYVQATVLPSSTAYVAYELNSRFWRRGIGTSAVAAMLDELGSAYGLRRFVAVLKTANHRSIGFLRSLGFESASASDEVGLQIDADEQAMMKPAGCPEE